MRNNNETSLGLRRPPGTPLWPRCTATPVKRGKSVSSRGALRRFRRPLLGANSPPCPGS